MSSNFKQVGSAIIFGGLVAILAGVPQVERVNVGSYQNPMNYVKTGNKVEAQVFDEVAAIPRIVVIDEVVPDRSVGYWEDVQKQLVFYGNPLFKFGDVERTAYKMSSRQDVVSGILAKDYSIVDNDGVIWKKVINDHKNIGYEPSK